MPIEIRELIISANVDTKGRKAGRGKRSGSLSGKRKEATVEATVDEVMRLLKKKKER